jgi:hypothetical protein
MHSANASIKSPNALNKKKGRRGEGEKDFPFFIFYFSFSIFYLPVDVSHLSLNDSLQ